MNCRCRERFEMRPRLKDRRIVEVNANQTLECSLEHRVYSCPDTSIYDRVLGATALILKHDDSRRRVPLEISAVVKLGPNDRSQLDALAQPLRARLENYEAAIAAERPQILRPGVTHRFYFLSDEPWPLWLQQLTAAVSHTEWAAILSMCTEPERFFEWPQVGELLWPGCTRGDEKQRHRYPVDVADHLLRVGIRQPDPRNNGPAIMAFVAAAGRRPTWGSQGWPIHHIYDGTAPLTGHPPVVHPAAQGGLHAVNEGGHFTHSAGLIAAHPNAHDLAHRSPLLKWLLRRESFLRFGYDPDHVFQTRKP